MMKIKQEVIGLTKAHLVFLLLAMGCSFCITAEYAITKPVSQSFFIQKYGSSRLPLVWLLTLPVNGFVVYLYNRLIDRISHWLLFCIATAATVFINTYSALFIDKYFFLSFLLYLWKDIYIMLMFQQLWSIIQTQFQLDRAKYLYGILFGIGGIGSILGGCVPGFFAIQLGSSRLLFCTAGIYAAFTLFYYCLLNVSIVDKGLEKPKEAKGGWKLIQGSKHLRFILLIVVSMQLVATLCEYQFTLFIEKQLPLLDQRTAFLGRLFSIVNAVNLCIQFIGSFVIVQYLGLRWGHISIPIILLTLVTHVALFPYFAVIAFMYGTVKSLDYSLFNILKEMLYTPLSTQEKFKAKAVIDVFAYRSAKALASLFTIVMMWIAPTHIFTSLSYWIAGILGLWVVSAVYYFRSRTAFSRH